MAASSGTIELHRRNIDRLMLQHGRHLRNMSRLILIVNNQSRIIAAEIRRQTVKLCDHDPAASTEAPTISNSLPDFDVRRSLAEFGFASSPRSTAPK